eukprot:3266844-Rhodomonas_salina.5
MGAVGNHQANAVEEGRAGGGVEKRFAALRRRVRGATDRRGAAQRGKSSVPRGSGVAVAVDAVAVDAAAAVVVDDDDEDGVVLVVVGGALGARAKVTMTEQSFADCAVRNSRTIAGHSSTCNVPPPL